MALEMREGNREVMVVDECALSQRIDLVLREIQIYYGDAHPEVLMVVDRIACLKVPSTTSEAWEMATAGDIASFSFFILFTSGVTAYLSTNSSWFWAIRDVTSSPFDFTFGSTPASFSVIIGTTWWPCRGPRLLALPMAGYQDWYKSSTRGVSALNLDLHECNDAAARDQPS